jgi:hypothetical protein
MDQPPFGNDEFYSNHALLQKTKNYCREKYDVPSIRRVCLSSQFGETKSQIDMPKPNTLGHGRRKMVVHVASLERTE